MKEIAENFADYSRLLEEPKITEDEIILRQKKNNVNWLDGLSGFCETPIPASLTCEQHKSNPRNFKCKIVCEKFGCEPVFRFDSEGTAHRNAIDSIPLPKQRVTTPHFHKFTEEGISLAYKTALLEDQQQSQAICSSIELGLAHFCQEANITTAANGLPSVTEEEPLLLNEAECDPLSNLEFP